MMACHYDLIQGHYNEAHKSILCAKLCTKMQCMHIVCPANLSIILYAEGKGPVVESAVMPETSVLHS